MAAGLNRLGGKLIFLLLFFFAFHIVEIGMKTHFHKIRTDTHTHKQTYLSHERIFAVCFYNLYFACKSLMILFFLLLFSFFFITLVDVIKPKPLPRNAINGNVNHTNSIINSLNTDSSSQTVIKSQSTITTNTTISNTIISNKTDSLIQKFSLNSTSNGKSPPEVLKRISGKQIATIFEVRIFHYFTLKVKQNKNCLLVALLPLLLEHFFFFSFLHFYSIL